MSGFNQYADKKPKKPKEEESEFKFINDKSLNMNKNEMRGLVKAMESPEFRDIMSEYMNDISDPKNKEEMEQYLAQCEENGELPPNTKLIRPTAGFCLKTTSSKLVNRKEKKYFEQKTFINITSHEVMDPPKKVERINNGKKGYSFELPYRVSKGRPDQDTKGDMCTTYDVVFHPEVISMSMIYGGEFLKFVCDTAIDGVSRVVSTDNEKISKDYKMMKQLRCKGGKPASITIKVENTNPIINSLDPSKHETSLHKEVMAQSKEAKGTKEGDKSGEPKETEEGEEDDEEELQKIEGIIEPKHKIVYSYPVNMGDCWEAPNDVLQDRKFPISIRITILTPHIETMKDAELDINDDTLLFKVPDTYDLMLSFKYRVDPDKGSATFEKDKKRLVIDMPIVGVTEVTHEIMKKEKEQFEKNMKRISGELVQDLDQYTQSVNTFETDIDLEKEVDLKKLSEEAKKENTIEDDKNFLKVYDESKNQPQEQIDDQPTVLNEIKFKEDENIDPSLIGINPLNNGVELVKEIDSTEVPENLDQIKAELGIPEKPKEKEIEYIEAMFQQRNELLFYMFKLPNYKQDDVKYFVSTTHLFIEHDTPEK